MKTGKRMAATMETAGRGEQGSTNRPSAPLSALKPGDRGSIHHIHTEEAKQLQKLMAMGVLPGSDIRLIQRFPSYVFQVGNSQFAVDEAIAAAIHVQLEK